MADNLTIGEWVSVAVTSVVAGMGGAMAWFRSDNLKRDALIASIKDDMKDFDRQHGGHVTKLAVIEACQENTRERLECIDVTTRDTNVKIEKMNETLTRFMIALKIPG